MGKVEVRGRGEEVRGEEVQSVLLHGIKGNLARCPEYFKRICQLKLGNS
jgi:hypothetical protein